MAEERRRDVQDNERRAASAERRRAASVERRQAEVSERRKLRDMDYFWKERMTRRWKDTEGFFNEIVQVMIKYTDERAAVEEKLNKKIRRLEIKLGLEDQSDEEDVEEAPRITEGRPIFYCEFLLYLQVPGDYINDVEEFGDSLTPLNPKPSAVEGASASNAINIDDGIRFLFIFYFI